MPGKTGEQTATGGGYRSAFVTGLVNIAGFLLGGTMWVGDDEEQSEAETTEEQPKVKSTVRVVVNSATMRVGGKVPELTFDAEGVWPDAYDVTFRHDVTEKSPPNDAGYPVTPVVAFKNPADAANYNVVIVPGVLIVKARIALRVSVNNAVMAAGGKVPDLTFDADGLWPDQFDVAFRHEVTEKSAPNAAGYPVTPVVTFKNPADTANADVVLVPGILVVIESFTKLDETITECRHKILDLPDNKELVAGLAEIEKLRDARESDPKALAEKVNALTLKARDLTDKKVAAEQEEAERKRVLAAKQNEARKAAEALRLEEERKKTEEERKTKELEDWKAALAAAKKQVEDWEKHAEIAEARDILAGFQPFIKNALALDKAIEGFPTDFDPAVPAQDRLRIALKVVMDAGKLLDAPAKAAVASREDDLDGAVAALTKAIETDKKAVGTEPRVDQIKLAAKKIPGLIDEVRERYRDEHTETPPQQKRRAAQLATQTGEIEKYERIGGWMNELGFGGAPRTGRNGVVFMAQVSNRIGPYKTHISQFAVNATIPENKLASTVEEAMDSLFRIESNFKCPHITLEIGGKGSADNAHYYMTDRFNGGAIAVEEMADYEAKMKAEFDRVMELFRGRLAKILK